MKLSCIIYLCIISFKLLSLNNVYLNCLCVESLSENLQCHEKSKLIPGSDIFQDLRNYHNSDLKLKSKQILPSYGSLDFQHCETSTCEVDVLGNPSLSLQVEFYDLNVLGNPSISQLYQIGYSCQDCKVPDNPSQSQVEHI